MEMPQARDRHWERRIALVILPTKEAIKELRKKPLQPTRSCTSLAETCSRSCSPKCMDESNSVFETFSTRSYRGDFPKNASDLSMCPTQCLRIFHHPCSVTCRASASRASSTRFLAVSAKFLSSS